MPYWLIGLYGLVAWMALAVFAVIVYNFVKWVVTRRSR